MVKTEPKNKNNRILSSSKQKREVRTTSGLLELPSNSNGFPKSETEFVLVVKDICEKCGKIRYKYSCIHENSFECCGAMTAFFALIEQNAACSPNVAKAYY
jgi:hypothetical protein